MFSNKPGVSMSIINLSLILDEHEVIECEDYLTDKVEDNFQNIYVGPRLLRRNFGLNACEAMSVFLGWKDKQDYGNL
jgi:hypothetical protein